MQEIAIAVVLIAVLLLFARTLTHSIASRIAKEEAIEAAKVYRPAILKEPEVQEAESAAADEKTTASNGRRA